MATKRRILIISLLIAVVGIISWLVLRPHDSEPTYQGKPLTYWLKGFGSGSPDEVTLKANEAVRQIGTNAIPTLLRLLKAKDSKFKLKFIQLTSKQHLINIKWRTSGKQQLEAEIGFGFFGLRGQICRSRPSSKFTTNVVQTRMTVLSALSTFIIFFPPSARQRPMPSRNWCNSLLTPTFTFA